MRKTLTFWGPLFNATVFLLGGAIVLAASLLLVQAARFGTGGTGDMSWPGASVSSVSGTARRVEQSLVVDALPDDQDLGFAWREVLSVGNLQVSADDFAFATIHWEGVEPGLKAQFFWRRAAEPGRIHSTDIPITPDSTATVRLYQQESWSGTVTELGIGLQGRLRSPVVLDEIRLEPGRVSALFSSIWDDWLAFEGWNSWSINFIVGGSRDPLLSPVVAGALWLSLSVCLYLGWRLMRRQQPKPAVLLLMVLSMWLVLDFRWQLDVWRQLAQTRAWYAGKSYQQKHLAAEDSPVFRFAETLKQHMANGTSRVFLITDDPAGRNRYFRLRLSYYLLPLNVYHRSRFIPGIGKGWAKNGDYVLVVAGADEVTFDPQTGELQQQLREWTIRLPAVPVFEDRLGRLYRVAIHDRGGRQP